MEFPEFCPHLARVDFGPADPEADDGLIGLVLVLGPGFPQARCAGPSGPHDDNVFSGHPERFLRRMAPRNLSTTLEHRRLRFTEQSLLLWMWMWQVG